MNAVEIEPAISELALQPFDAAEFPYAFLAAFGNKEVTLKRLRSGNNNTSDLPSGVLLRNNIHIAVCEAANVSETFAALLASPATTKGKAKFILATDGQTLEAEDLAAGETIACDYPDFPDHFGFFLPLAGISTVKEIKDNPIDVRATGHLNKLYVELLRENPGWATVGRRGDMNHFMARLIFCFFAEDTDIFNGDGLFHLATFSGGAATPDAATTLPPKAASVLAAGAAAAAAAAPKMDLDAISLDLNPPSGAMPLDKPSATMPLGRSSATMPLASATASTGDRPTLDFGDFTLPAQPNVHGGLDENDPLARKLELAEEFRQIGDMEGARDLLEQVIAKAGGALKNKAQGMLDSLA